MFSRREGGILDKLVIFKVSSMTAGRSQCQTGRTNKTPTEKSAVFLVERPRRTDLGSLTATGT